MTQPFIAQNALAVPGFKEITDPAIPQKIKDASRSIFKINSPGGEFVRMLDMRDAKSVGIYREVLKSSDNNWWESTQIDFCETYIIADCPLFKEWGRGTLFLAGTNTTAYTNYHIFYEVLSAEVQNAHITSRADIYKTLAQNFLLMKLKDQNQNVVFNFLESARLNFFNPDYRIYDGTKNILLTPLGRISDIVEITLGRDIGGTPLKIATDKPKVGDTLYLVGFPSETNNRRARGGEDSDGKSIYVTVGKRISTQDWQKKISSTVQKEVEKALDQYMIFADFDCEHGNSGGPILNERGEVVGIMMALYNQPNARICGGLSTLNKTYLDFVWKMLAH